MLIWIFLADFHTLRSFVQNMVNPITTKDIFTR